MMAPWEEMQDDEPIAYNIIDEGLTKLDNYHNHVNMVPAYHLVMCRFQLSF